MQKLQDVTFTLDNNWDNRHVVSCDSCCKPTCYRLQAEVYWLAWCSWQCSTLCVWSSSAHCWWSSVDGRDVWTADKQANITTMNNMLRQQSVSQLTAQRLARDHTEI